MRRGRGLITALLIVSLLCTGGMQYLVRKQREARIPRPRTALRTSGIDTFTLGLVLGGLRGPLVMFLWTSTENRKAERNLEDMDTQIELIRMLQPEYDSVHIFQIWNKAYNLSVQMASLPNKYATILGALDYGRTVDAERPDNINILAQIGDVYAQKLGGAQEKKYYMQRVRNDTLSGPLARAESSDQRSWQPLQHPAMLDSRGFILPSLLKPKWAQPVGGYDGSELQCLARYNTPEAGGFPYGISPLALGYNYLKRANILMIATGQKHIQVSDGVIDSRPAVDLRFWAEEERDRGVRRELQALGKAVPESKNSQETMLAGMPVGGKLEVSSEKAKKSLQEAIFSFGRSGQVARHSREEYDRHMKNPDYAYNSDVYFCHIDTVVALGYLSDADHDYLLAAATSAGLVTPGGQSAQQLREAAVKKYQQAIDAYYYLNLRYYVDDQVAMQVYPAVTQQLTGTSVRRAQLRSVDPKFYPAMYLATKRYIAANRSPQWKSDWADDEAEYEACIARAEQRLTQLKQQ